MSESDGVPVKKVSVGTQTLPISLSGDADLLPVQPLSCDISLGAVDADYVLPSPLVASTPWSIVQLGLGVFTRIGRSYHSFVSCVFKFHWNLVLPILSCHGLTR